MQDSEGKSLVLTDHALNTNHNDRITFKAYSMAKALADVSSRARQLLAVATENLHYTHSNIQADSSCT